MRPQQQNRRMRGRNNNNNNGNRKGPNPLTRNYESNGPDVKIRGSAQQIAEKYTALARDAQSSGDRVMAENYLQHAEHYNRIIAAAQAQMPIQQQPQARDDFDDEDEDRDDFDAVGNVAGPAETQQPAVNHGAGPQPVIDDTPAEVALNTENGRDHGGNRHFRERDRRHGGYQNGQNHGQRNDQNRNEQYGRREEAQPEAAAPAAAGLAESTAQPDLGPAALAAQAEHNEFGADQGARRPRRPRRSRRPDQDGATADAGGGEGGDAAASEASGSDTGLIPAET